MRAIGGELELERISEDIYFTDSGRSSLRLFLRSEENHKMKYLLPNFFCEVIENVFIEESINYSFYNINEDLTVDIDLINNSDYDVLYIINYFGKYIDLSEINLEDKVLIEDNVFLYNFENHWNAEKWYAFNSFRKIGSFADGSLVKTNMKINSKFILNEEAKFVPLKYKAKEIKYSYIHEKTFSESDYLNKFQLGESILDEQKSIYSISKKSIYLLTIQDNNQILRVKRFNLLLESFKEYAIMKTSDCYSFFVMKLKNRDGFRKKLMKENIFLSVHWPVSTQENDLYESIISIPLFETYDDETFNRLMKTIKETL